MNRAAVILFTTVFILALAAKTVNDYYPTIVNIAKEPNRIVKPRPKSKPLEQIAKKKGIRIPLNEPVIKIYKSKRELGLYNGNRLVKTYQISLGFTPVGDKLKQGDGKTPEGIFYITQKAKHPDKAYLGTRWMRLSYPSKKHAETGLKNGTIGNPEYQQIISSLNNMQTPPQNTPLGGGIGIHGGTDTILGGIGIDWTAGCIGLYDKDVEEIYEQTKIGTKVLILR